MIKPYFRYLFSGPEMVFGVDSLDDGEQILRALDYMLDDFDSDEYTATDIDRDEYE